MQHVKRKVSEHLRDYDINHLKDNVKQYPLFDSLSERENT